MSNPAALRRILRGLACGPQLPRVAAGPERKLTRRRYSRQSGRAVHSRACHEMSCSVMRCREPPCSAEFQFGFGQRRQASRLHPLPLPLRRPVHPDAASRRAYHASSQVNPALPCAQGRRAVVAGGRAAAFAGDFDFPAVLFLRQSLRQMAASDGPRACHEMSCSVMRCHVPPRHARLRRPRRSAACLHPACRPSIAFRSVRAAAGLPAARPFFARIACACVRAFRVGAHIARLIARASEAQGARLPSVSLGVFRAVARQEAKRPPDAASSCSILPQFCRSQTKLGNISKLIRYPINWDRDKRYAANVAPAPDRR